MADPALVEVLQRSVPEWNNLVAEKFQENHLWIADLKDAHLRGIDLYGANLRRAHLQKADLRGANLCYADLEEADLGGADLQGAGLRQANLSRSNLREAKLRRTDLREADLRMSNLREADLCDADLGGADLCNVDLRRADLYGTNFQGVDLRGAMYFASDIPDAAPPAGRQRRVSQEQLPPETEVNPRSFAAELAGQINPQEQTLFTPEGGHVEGVTGVNEWKSRLMPSYEKKLEELFDRLEAECRKTDKRGPIRLTIAPRIHVDIQRDQLFLDKNNKLSIKPAAIIAVQKAIDDWLTSAMKPPRRGLGR